MRFGKRRKDDDEDAAESAEPVSVESAPPPAEAVTSWTASAFDDPPAPVAYVEPEPVVEGDAVELPAEPVPEPFARPVAEPMPMPFAVAEPPEAFATGQAPMAGPAWPDPIAQMARERPEYVVGAAFVGGLLAAMILRRLGN